MYVTKSKNFANGSVFALKTIGRCPIEITDTFLPLYTKHAINNKSNKLLDQEVGDRNQRWMIGVSTMSGCPVGCKFCATGSLKRCRNLIADEIVEQVLFIVDRNKNVLENPIGEFKINYTRMGEPFLNLKHVQRAIKTINYILTPKVGIVHHYISTIGIKGADFSWIKNNITLQLSVHSLDDERRRKLIPYKQLMSLKELGEIRTGSNLKTTINLTLVDKLDFDIEKLKEYFDPKYFFIKLSPININETSVKNSMGNGIIESVNIL